VIDKILMVCVVIGLLRRTMRGKPLFACKLVGCNFLRTQPDRKITNSNNCIAFFAHFG